MELQTETEKMILKAAREVFSEKGLAGARMQEIADKAGINKAMLHYYFRSKDKLFEQIFKEAFTEFWPEIEISILVSINVKEFLKHTMSKYIDLFIDKPYLPIFILTEVNSNPTRLEKLMKESGINPPIIIDYLKKRMSEGEIKEMNPYELLINIISLCIFPFAGRPLLSRMLFNGDMDAYNKIIEKRKQTLFEFLKPLIINNNNK